MRLIGFGVNDATGKYANIRLIRPLLRTLKITRRPRESLRFMTMTLCKHVY